MENVQDCGNRSHGKINSGPVLLQVMRSPDRLFFEDQFAADHGPQHLCTANGLRVSVDQVGIQQDQIGQFPLFDPAFFAVLERAVGGA